MQQETTLLEKLANTPPVAVAGYSILGFSLTDWAAIVTIAYTLMLIYFRLRREFRKWQARREARDSGLPMPPEDDDEHDTDKAPL